MPAGAGFLPSTVLNCGSSPWVFYVSFCVFFFLGGCERFFSTNSKLSVFLVVDVMFLFAGRGVRFLSPKMILVGFKMPWSL